MFEKFEVKKIKINKGFDYDEDLFIENGEYDFIEEGYNGYAMILVNDEWLDVIIEMIDYEEIK